MRTLSFSMLLLSFVGTTLGHVLNETDINKRVQKLDYHNEGEIIAQEEVKKQLSKFLNEGPQKINTSDIVADGPQFDQTPQQQDPRPIRILFDYDQLTGVTEEQRKFLLQEVFPAAEKELSSQINVRRPIIDFLGIQRTCLQGYQTNTGALYCLDYKPDTVYAQEYMACGTAIMKEEHYASFTTCNAQTVDGQVRVGNCAAQEVKKQGVQDKDLIIYVTSSDQECSSSLLAYGAGCNWDYKTQRPLVGYINICLGKLTDESEDSSNNFDKWLAAVTHEVVHVLGFSESVFQAFVDATTLQPLGIDNIVEDVYGDGTTLKVITPTVVAAVRDHFDCPSLDGALLEDEGDQGTAFSHWESRLFQGELMDGVAGQGDMSTHHSLSPLTLALLQDSGWYTTEIDSAAPIQFGKGLGCDFVLNDCNSLDQDVSSAFCHVEDEYACTHDYSSVGICFDDDLLMNSCKRTVPLNDMHCTVKSNMRRRFDVNRNAPDYTYFGATHSAYSRCIPEKNDILVTMNNGEEKFQKQSVGFDCYEIRCGEIMEVGLFGKYFACPTGETITFDAEDMGDGVTFQGTIGPCPDNEEMCALVGCPNACSGNGRCDKGKCNCFMGYVGDDCQQPA